LKSPIDHHTHVYQSAQTADKLAFVSVGKLFARLTQAVTYSTAIFYRGFSSGAGLLFGRAFAVSSAVTDQSNF